jgi:hypothetical protein
LLDKSPRQSARYHCDKHVVKMTLEAAQILCTAHWLCDGEIGEGWYRPTHTGHPVVRWAAHCTGAYAYAWRQFKYLAAEYEYRYGREHLSWTKLGGALEQPPWYCTDSAAEPWFPLCMPSVYWPAGSVGTASLPEAVAAYRRYYGGEKQRMFKWTKRDVPDWLQN